jgi:hypothetical protein
LSYFLAQPAKARVTNATSRQSKQRENAKVDEQSV